MIQKSTTFVIGAGASHVYNLPTGEGIWRTATLLEPRHDVFQLLLAAGFRVEDVRDFISQASRYPGEHSLDAFLSIRQHEPNTLKLGRAVIAALMGQAIATSQRLDGGDSDWLGYVIRKMFEGVHTFEAFKSKNAGARFVTFNFDSILEHRLVDALSRAGWRGAEDDLPPIIHVHGRLPAPPKESMNYRAWVSWLETASKQVNVVFDSDVSPDAVDSARKAVESGAIICCLGFSYHPDNVSRIGLNSASGKVVFGTAFGMKNGERKTAEGRFPLSPSVTLGGENEDCLHFLRDHYIFRD